ncbi:putative Prophage PSPPH06, tail sheath protein [Vibrio chagasii]|nr:putative Prophage PSPPH06, tail sheath protein [Vibrio chagasii]CAH7326135.1 putative Prophage PSPPH06, tail sheath protein [Vibrio chagasii]CAH7445789.1 putative Prophage PSPPH06, tail sheath protein [Vibrio chagasii]CAH7460830.1 putative Prophage PSPPH06, tail sheath protein [Vibrio chagasii]
MATGKVEVNNLNLGQGGIPEIERHLLFIGKTDKAELQGKVTRVNNMTNLDEVVADDALGANVKAAQLNGKQNWTGAIFGLGSDDTWQAAVDLANQTDSFEGICIVDVVKSKDEFTDMQDKATELTSKLGRWVFFLAACSGIDATEESGQTWSEYETAMLALVKDVSANMVTPVPQLNGNNVGVLAGRLCDRAVTVADSPMRVSTGSLLGLGEMPVDKNSQALEMSTIGALADARYSLPQWYADMEGVYWTDATTLEAKGGDYQFLEYVRPVHKLNRRVRIKAIRRIADRILNSTPPSIELNRTYFSKDMRDMSKTTEIGGIQFPGEIMPPSDEDVTITWESKTKVVIGLMVTPHNCPKHIVVNIGLDLSNPTDAEA